MNFSDWVATKAHRARLFSSLPLQALVSPKVRSVFQRNITGGASTTACRQALAEPAVVITDYLLALETAAFAVATARRPANKPGLRSWLALFFGSISVAALAGGTAHGFSPQPERRGHRVLWIASYAAIGVTTLATWIIGAEIALPPPVARWVKGTAMGLMAAYLAVTLSGRRRFVVAIVTYIPATAFLLAALMRQYRQTGKQPLLAGVVGSVLTFVAAAVQVRRINLHPHLFDHNALYHAIQGVALALLFIGGRALLDSPLVPPAQAKPVVAKKP